MEGRKEVDEGQEKGEKYECRRDVYEKKGGEHKAIKKNERKRHMVDRKGVHEVGKGGN